MAHRGAWERAAYRVLVVVVAVLCLSSQLASFTHMLCVRHVTCPEHGELIDVPAVAVGAPHAPAAESIASDSGQAAHAHDHCLVAAIAAQAMAPSSPPTRCEGAAGPVQRTTERVVARPEPVPAPASIALLLLAPKSSPPLRAAA